MQEATDSAPDATERLAVVVAAMRADADPDRATSMRSYMKDIAPFLGIQRPRRTELAKPYLVWAASALTPAQVLATMAELYALPEREFCYLGVDLLLKTWRRFGEDDMLAALPFIDRTPWWDSVDAIRKPISLWCLARPAADRSAIYDRLGSSMWRRRVAITMQLQWKERTDESRLAAILDANLPDREFFIQKAIGWALRDYSRHAPEWVAGYLGSRPVVGLARREASKYLD